jgi:queuine/archaeosine tRNA-ribosyltransferase
MLLTIHNLNHYKRFFEAIRDCIKNDKLKELTILVSEQYKDAEKVLNYEPIVKKEDTSKSKRKLSS